MRERKRAITIRATSRQVERWELAARVLPDGVQRWGGAVTPRLERFLALAADLLARRWREIQRERAKADPVGQRLTEKAVLGRLLVAAEGALSHLPNDVVDTYYGPAYPKRDLKRAIEDVRSFLRETGEEYGNWPWP